MRLLDEAHAVLLERASRSSSSGSMTTKRDLSYSKCRSISGSVPLPIEPKPIMTMGPVILAWIGEAGSSGVSGSRLARERGELDQGSGGAALRGDFDLDLHLGLVEPGHDQQRRRRADVAETSPQTAKWASASLASVR